MFGFAKKKFIRDRRREKKSELETKRRFRSVVEEGDVSRSSQVETERPTNLNNLFRVRNDLRDRHMHERLKNDLIKNIWNKFGDED